MQLELDATSFSMLYANRMVWQGEDWESQAADRFRTVGGNIESIHFFYKYSYWFDSAPAVVLARAYLISIEAMHQVLTDEAGLDHGCPYLIVTDYES
jgi:hypothetical protein